MKRENEMILNELNTIYSKREQYLSEDQDLLLETHEKYQEKLVHIIKNWLTINRDYLKQSLKTSKKLTLKGLKHLRH